MRGAKNKRVDPAETLQGGYLFCVVQFWVNFLFATGQNFHLPTERRQCSICFVLAQRTRKLGRNYRCLAHANHTTTNSGIFQQWHLGIAFRSRGLRVRNPSGRSAPTPSPAAPRTAALE